MSMKKYRTIHAYLLAFAVMLAALPLPAFAQTGTAAKPENPYAARLASIEEYAEKRRVELGIPGMSLVIVKDDDVIFAKGFGYRDLEKKTPVTADTQFPIASATKAFTGLSVLMTAEDGKFSLSDPPKKVLPYFKMADPDTDKNITIRDLLTHSSGLTRTDLAMITGRLTRQELIRVVGEAKPDAKLGEKFGYQNVMYAAAGEAVAKAQKMPWERFVPERIFKPLDMTNSTVTAADMQKAKDHALGYNYNTDTKEHVRVPFREIPDTAPAGAINSSANDMAKWLRFLLNRGKVGNKPLISDASFAEWIKPHMKVTPTGSVSYGLGWFIQTWNGMTVVQHGGNIDGFTSMVGFMPEKRLGFALLMNVGNSPLGNELMDVIWDRMLRDPAAVPALTADEMQKLAGKYELTPTVEIDVSITEGKLVMTVPGQPPYTLEPTGPRKFKPAGLPEGFAAGFSPAEGEAAVLELIQPNGTFKAQRAGTKPAETAPEAGPNPAKELVGKYDAPGAAGLIEVKDEGGKVTFNIPGQQPYELRERKKDEYALQPLPDTYFLTVKRDEKGGVAAVAVNQPEGVFEFKRSAAGNTDIGITVEELMKKAVDALGGEANMRRITSRVTEMDVNLENQGVRARSTMWNKAPNRTATETKLYAIGKNIGQIWSYFDGNSGEEIYTFAPTEKYTGKRLADAARDADLLLPLQLDKYFSKIEIIGKGKAGDEETWIVSFTPREGTPYREHYSTKTFRPVRREGVIVSGTSSIQLPYTTEMSDYREVDGVWLPFRIVTDTPTMGRTVAVTTSVRHNVAIDDKLFTPRKLD
jgi:CubicO group peptidase (beta-lactamase class C family)